MPTAVRPSTRQFGAPLLKSEQLYDLKDDVLREAMRAEGASAQTELQPQLYLPILPSDSQRTSSQNNPAYSFNTIFVQKETKWSERERRREKQRQKKRAMKEAVKKRLRKEKLQKKEQ